MVFTGPAVGAPAGLSAGTLVELGALLRTSVVEKTSRGYDRHWDDWVSFVRDEMNYQDPLMRHRREEEKALLIGAVRQGEAGQRATADSCA